LRFILPAGAFRAKPGVTAAVVPEKSNLSGTPLMLASFVRNPL
jgi:hypothetical protein